MSLGKTLKKHKLLSSICIILLILGIGFYILKGTICYSFFHIYHSIRNHDVETFQTYVDIDSVLDNLGYDLEKSFYQSMLEETTYDSEWSAFGVGIAAMVMPKFIDTGKRILKREILRQIEEIREPEELAEQTKPVSEEEVAVKNIINREEFNLKEIFSKIKKYEINKKGKAALLNLNVEDKEKSVIIHMRNMPGRYWRVVRLEIPALFKSEAEKQIAKKVESPIQTLAPGEFPQRAGYINDFANLISLEDSQKLDMLANELELKTAAELVVVTINTTKPYDIQDYSVRLFERWNIGKAGKDNGILLLVAIEDKKVWITTGYGLEQAVPDSEANRVYLDIITPHFKEGEFSKGILAGSIALVDLVACKYNVNIEKPILDADYTEEYRAYYQSIREKVRKFLVKNYPRYIASGEVYLYFVLYSNGELKEVRVIEERSSQNPQLREIAKKSLIEAAPFLPFPKILSEKQSELSLTYIASFELEVD